MTEEILSLAEWTSVLKLAAMWQMERLQKIVIERMRLLTVDEPDGWTRLLDLSVQHLLSAARALAIERLSQFYSIKEVAKVQLARKYHVVKWLKEGYEELVRREAFFSNEEEELLGSKTIIKLCRVRDGYLKSRHNSIVYHPGPPTMIEAEFETELEEMRLGWINQGDPESPRLVPSWS
jgi:hypothetical protein